MGRGVAESAHLEPVAAVRRRFSQLLEDKESLNGVGGIVDTSGPPTTSIVAPVNQPTNRSSMAGAEQS